MTNQEIKTTGQTIAQETQIGGNTAGRVGGVIEGIGVALDNKDAANGYYQATINGGSISVNAPNYLLGTSGNLRLKMPAAGTTASTLTIGNANAVQLWYNGAAVSSDNTWEADEIISVFYDGTRFMASNSQGGGGKAEKIKYNNSQSGLAAENVQGAIDEVDDELKNSIYDVQLVNISSSYTISNGQAYGNVGSVINTNTDRNFSKVYIAKDDNKAVRFITHASYDVSSYVQFVKAGNIITRRLYVSGDYDKNTEYTLKLNFKDDEIGVYVSGTNNSLIIYNLLYVDKFLLKEELLPTLSDEDEPVSGKAVCDAFSRNETTFFDINKGKQAYGTVGSAINVGTFQPMEYVRLADAATVQFKSMQQSVTVSSYVQYVDSNNIVTRLLYTSTSPNTVYTHKIEFQEGEVAVYVSSALNYISVTKNLIPDLLDLTTVQEPESLVYNNTEAYALYNYEPYRKYLLTGVVGGTIQTARTDGGICLKIPLDGVSKITYPMFLSSGGYGSVICDANDIIVWFYSNSTEPTGTYKEVDVSNIPNAKWAYITIYGVNSYNIYIKKAGVKTIDFLRNLLSGDYTSSDTDKALNLEGAHALYELINSLSEKGSSSGLDGFNDFGEMPSCVYGDGNAFLGDGVDGQGNAIIKYSDVIAKYDALVAAYPAFVTKQTLGYDASNTIEMYSYTFTPKYYRQSVYLQAGVHGWEPDPVFALCEMMYLICNAYGSDTLSPCIRGNNVLKYLRGNVKFTIVPVVNPWGFNNRADCGIDKRQQAQNNYNGVQLNSAAQWSGNEPECVYVRNIITSISSELSFAIDMHSTVWPDSRTRYGCFYGIINRNAANVPTIYRTYEWLYEFYNQKYPSIVQGDTVPNLLGEGKASIGYLDGIFHSWIYDHYNVEASTMEFSDHVWTAGLHTSTALSVAVNMYINQIVQQLNDKYKDVTPTDIPSSDYYPAKG